MQAIILAAGRGLSLKPITERIPKVLVKVNNIPFIINELEALSKHKEIKEAIIVIGYKKDLIKRIVGNKYRNIRITYIESDKWDKTNNIYSFWLARKHIKEDFILLEGDLFFEHKLIDILFKNRDKNIVLLAKYKSYMSGTVVEINPDSTIKNLIPSYHQDISLDYSNKYKAINIYFFTYEFFKNHLEPNLTFYIKSHAQNYWELILGVLVYLNTPNIYARIVDDGTKWYEVDDENDLDMANYIFAEDGMKIKQISKFHGGLWRYDLIDFYYLTNVYFPPEQFYTVLSSELSQLVQNYPSAQDKISKLLSRWYTDKEFNENNILVSNGVSELIRILNRHFIKKITIPVPTFNEYEDLEKKQINYFRLKERENFILNPDEYINSVKRSGSNFALIINPNNPTGTLTAKKDIIKILEKLKSLDGIIVDESFINFTGDRKNNSVQPLVNKYPNLIIIHSIGKEFGVLGLRLGYMLTSNHRRLNQVKRYLPIWNINSVAERFVELFPKYQNNFYESLRRINKDRNYLYSKLKEIKFLKTFPSCANFFLCKLVDNITSEELCAKLFQKNIYVKNCSNKTLLGNKFIRITVRTEQDNNLLTSTLREIAKEIEEKRRLQKLIKNKDNYGK